MVNAIELSAGTESQVREAAALFAREFPHRAQEVSVWANEPETQRFIFREQARPVIAYGSMWHTGNGKFRIDLVVRESYRRRGFGNAMLEHLLGCAAAQQARTVQARSEQDAAAALSFLEHRAFHETMRMHRFELRLDGGSPLGMPPTEPELEIRGIVITTLAAELARGAEVYGELAAVYDAAGDEWPDPDPGGPRSPLNAERVKAMFDRWQALPHAVFIARTSDQYVGFAGLGVAGRSVGTGVRPAFRRLGVATALKTRLIQWAAEQGMPMLQSASGHPAMIRLNEKLGFRQSGVEVRLVRRLA